MPSPERSRKHPLHPMLIGLPIGLWAFSLVSDLLYLTNKRDPVWNDVAFRTMAGGTVGAAVVAVPGIIDFLSLRDSKARKVGFIHLVLDLALAGLYARNLWLRTRSRPGSPLPITLSAAGAGLIGLSGWLCSKMAYSEEAAEPDNANGSSGGARPTAKQQARA